MFNVKPLILYALAFLAYRSLEAMEESPQIHIPPSLQNIPLGIINYMHSLPRLACEKTASIENKATNILTFLFRFGTHQSNVPWRRNIIR